MSKYDILPFGIGFVCGVAATCAACYYFYKTKYEAEESNPSEQDKYEKPDFVEEKIVLTKVAEKPSIEELKARVKGSAETIAREEGDEAEYISDENGYDGADQKIELITEDDFLQSPLNKEGIEYDPVENRVYDENGVEMKDWMTWLLADMPEHFGYGTDDPNCCYIRNNELGIDYEILRRMTRK